jgi:hypothetical protein
LRLALGRIGHKHFNQLIFSGEHGPILPTDAAMERRTS